MQKRKSLIGRWSEKGGKAPETLCFLSKKRKGVEAFFSPTTGRVETSAIFYTKCTGGGVLSCSESTPVLQGSHHILFTIVCGWRRKKKEKKKRREQWRERKPASLCRKRERELVFIWVCQKKQDFFPHHTNSQEHLALFEATLAAYERASRAGKQRHPGFSWWWELTSDWFPWILMWRIVCFIEEQKEARWLPLGFVKEDIQTVCWNF